MRVRPQRSRSLAPRGIPRRDPVFRITGRAGNLTATSVVLYSRSRSTRPNGDREDLPPPGRLFSRGMPLLAAADGRRSSGGTEAVVMGIRFRTFLAVGLASCAPLRADANSRTAGTTGPLEMVVERPDLKLYEPLVVSYRFRNDLDHEILAPGSLKGLLQLWVRRQKETAERSISLGFGCGVLVYTTFPTGYVKEDTLVVLDDPGTGSLVLDAPGTYELRLTARYGGRDEAERVSLETDWTTIRVTPPGQELDSLGGGKRFVAFWRYGFRKYCGDLPGPRCFESLKTFIELHPESPYSPHVAWAIHLYGDYADLLGAKAWRERTAMAESFLDRWPDHPLAPRLMLSLARLHRSVDRQRALALADELAKRPGYAPAAQALRTELTWKPAPGP